MSHNHDHDTDKQDHRPQPNKMADLVGPLYAAASVATILDIAVDDLDAEVVEGRLLRVHTSDGTAPYPTFQFGPNNHLRTELAPILVILAGSPEWAAAVWLLTPNAALRLQTPLHAAATSDTLPLVRHLASQWKAT